MSTVEKEEGSVLDLDFDKLRKVTAGGEALLPVVVQDSRNGEVLILAYANREALEHALRTGKATFWSSSRGELWVKGETSGDWLRLDEVRVNCEQNSLLYRVTPQGKGSCHTRDADGRSRSACYYRRIVPGSGDRLEFVEPARVSP